MKGGIYELFTLSFTNSTIEKGEHVKEMEDLLANLKFHLFTRWFPEASRYHVRSAWYTRSSFFSSVCIIHKAEC